jgi:hydrogenase maturation protein HypF
MENYETFCAFKDGVDHYERLFRVKPEILAYDLHPDYMATRYALARAEREGLPAEGVQHHHAHIAACMVEHGVPDGKSVIGVSFDGTGYGEDGAIWGGEFLLADYRHFERPHHLTYIPLLGGEAAVRQPWRLALAWLIQADLEWDEDIPPIETAGPEAREMLKRMFELRINAPLTSSMGRLFDAVSSLANVRQEINYEAQAAIELEAMVDPDEEGVYPFAFADENINPVPVIREIVDDLRAGVSAPKIAARFHNGVAHMVDQVCRAIRDQSDVEEVALSGGVWQNMVLLSRTVRLLRQSDFKVYVHRQVPTNDGGLSLGQAVVAAHRLAFSHQLSAVSRGAGLAEC